MQVSENIKELVKKLNKKDSVNAFVNTLFKEEGVETFKTKAKNGQLQSLKIRSMAWRVFLGEFSSSDTFDQWISHLFDLREEYKKKSKNYLKTPKFTGDPLKGGNPLQTSSSSTWKTYYKDNDTRKLIGLDLDRTYQELDLFREEKIKKSLGNILFFWAKDNEDVGYQQGMNDILSVIFLALYPYYYKLDQKQKSLKKEDLISFASEEKSALEHSSDLYMFFHDEEEIETDLFYCYSNLMKRGLKELFDNTNLGKEKQEISFAKYELFHNAWDHMEGDLQNNLNIRCTMIVNEKLKSIDYELYQHFKKIGLNCSIFLQRWLKCIFNREFELDEILVIWDAIFATQETKAKYGLIFIDYLTISMIIRIRSELLQYDQNECFMMLFKYPKIENICDLISFANKVEEGINMKINGQKSEFLDNLIGSEDLKNLQKGTNVSCNETIENIYDYGYSSSIKNQNNMKSNEQNIDDFLKEKHSTTTEIAKEKVKGALNSLGGFFGKMKNKMEKAINNININQKEDKKEESINVAFNSNTSGINNNEEAAKILIQIYNKNKSKIDSEDIDNLASVIEYLKMNNKNK